MEIIDFLRYAYLLWSREVKGVIRINVFFESCSFPTCRCLPRMEVRKNSFELYQNIYLQVEGVVLPVAPPWREFFVWELPEQNTRLTGKILVCPRKNFLFIVVSVHSKIHGFTQPIKEILQGTREELGLISSNFSFYESIWRRRRRSFTDRITASAVSGKWLSSVNQAFILSFDKSRSSWPEG